MSGDLRKIINDLRSLVETLKVRCSAAEHKAAEKDKEIEALKTQNSDFETQLAELTSKYESLKDGMAQVRGSDDIDRLKGKYLALVREIDDCIRLMQHGR